MNFIFDIPVVFKVLGSLGIILICNRFFKQLIIPVFIAITILAFWCGHSPEIITGITLKRLFSVNNLFLLLIVFQIIALSSQMSETGSMKDLLQIVRARISKRMSMAVLPAIIGFLPMPGGALFSAPLVADCDHENHVDALLKTRINYWFRHIWEYWWPLYPGVLLAIEITGLETWQFILLMFPFCMLSIAVGYWFLLRDIPIPEENPENNDKFHWTEFFKPLLPIITVILVTVIIRLFVPFLAGINKYFPMVTGIILAMMLLQFQHPLNWAKWKKILFTKNMLNLLILVALIRIYGAFIEADLSDGTTVVGKMREEMAAIGISTVLLSMIIPFIAGLTTGLAIGFVGASFPIVVSLMGADPSLSVVLSTTALAYVFGYMGMILSPVHVCLVVTNQHFNTELFDAIKKLAAPAVVMLVLATIIFFIINQLAVW